MHSKKIVRLAAVNWAVFVKGFLFQIFTVGIIVAVFSLIVSDFFVAVSGAVAEAGILDAFSGMINGIFDLFNGKISGAALGEAIEKFFGTIKDFFELVPDFASNLALSVVLFVVATTLLYFLSGMTDLPTLYCLNKFMSTNNSGFYTWSYFRQFVNSLWYNFLRMVAGVVIDIVIVAAVIGSALLFFVNIGIAGAVISILFALVLCAIRVNIFAFWLPCRLVTGEKITKAFKDGLKTSLDGFWWLFLNNLIIIAVCAAVCFALVVILNNIILALCLCFVVFYVATYFLNCSALVHYYENIGKPYFTKKVNIGLSDEAN